MACIRAGIVLNGRQAPGIHPVSRRDERHWIYLFNEGTRGDRIVE